MYSPKIIWHQNQNWDQKTNTSYIWGIECRASQQLYDLIFNSNQSCIRKLIRFSQRQKVYFGFPKQYHQWMYNSICQLKLKTIFIYEFIKTKKYNEANIISDYCYLFISKSVHWSFQLHVHLVLVIIRIDLYLVEHFKYFYPEHIFRYKNNKLIAVINLTVILC